MPRYSDALADLRRAQEASIGQRRGGIETGGLLGLHGIEEQQALKRALEKQERAQRAMQKRRGVGRIIGGGLGIGAGLLTTLLTQNPLLGYKAAMAVGGGIGSYTGQKIAAKRGVQAKRIKDSKFYTETRASANRALRDWMRDYKTSQVTGALTDAFSAYQLGNLAGGDISKFLSRFGKKGGESMIKPLTMPEYFSTQNPYRWEAQGLNWGG